MINLAAKSKYRLLGKNNGVWVGDRLLIFTVYLIIQWMCNLASPPFSACMTTFPLGAKRALAVTGNAAWSGTFDATSALGPISKLASRFGYVRTLLPPASPMPDTRQIGTAGLSHSYRNRDFFVCVCVYIYFFLMKAWGGNHPIQNPL